MIVFSALINCKADARPAGNTFEPWLGWTVAVREPKKLQLRRCFFLKVERISCVALLSIAYKSYKNLRNTALAFVR
jgi:hypothetical protein